MILDRILYNSITKALGGRGDGSPTLPYWTSEQLGLSKEPFSFVSGKVIICIGFDITAG